MIAVLASRLQDALGASYRIEQEIEGGGMSRLFLATQLDLNRKVVVKVLPPDLTSETTIARFKREIEITVNLQHPNILPVLAAGSVEDVLYYISLYIPGESLRARLKREGKLPLSDVVRILREAGDALAYAHGRGVVHRDIKPGNILLHEGHAVLADFGIARALSTTLGNTTLTGTGARPGTPAYMPPELRSDERADVYGLGVVAYEMLTGALPPDAVSATAVVAQRDRVAGDHRPEVRRVAEAVAQALAADPDRRFSSTAEFTAALVPAGRRRAPWIVTGAAITAFTVWAVVAAPWRPRVSGGTDRAVVFLAPTRALDASDSALAELMTPRLQEAFREWQDVSLVADPRVRELITRRGAFELQDARAAARSADANTLVWTEVVRVHDSVAVNGWTYETSAPTSARSARVLFPAGDDAALKMAMRRLASALLREGPELPWTSATDTGHHSVLAWRAYDAGRAALSTWDLPAARSALERAVRLEPRHGRAQLWLAQTLVWLASDSTPNLAATARVALGLRDQLSAHDAQLAEALWALAEGRFPDACRDFAKLVAADSSDLTGWIGAGECRRRDRQVINDPRSPSGMAFRGSYHSAARAYQRAADVAPPALDPAFRGWVVARLSDVLFQASNKLRTGLAASNAGYLSQAMLLGDTLSFAPVPLKALQDRPVNINLDWVDAAVARNLETLRRAAEQWVLRAPNSVEAYASLAEFTDAAGGYASLGTQRLSALDVARRARALARDDSVRFRLAILETRLLLKDEQFEAARRSADSVLAAAARADYSSPDLGGLAILLGRPALAVRLLQAKVGEPRVAGPTDIVEIPPALLKLRLALVGYAAVGIPVDSVRAIAARADQAIAPLFPKPAAASQVRSGILAMPLSLMFPTDGDRLGSVVPPDRIVEAQQLALQDPVRGRSAVEGLLAQSGRRPPALAVDRAFRLARLALFLGDTSAAIAELDRMLGALPTLTNRLFAEPAQIGALLRVMTLRADLEGLRGTTEPRRWAYAMAVLWSSGEAVVQPVVERMKGLELHR